MVYQIENDSKIFGIITLLMLFLAVGQNLSAGTWECQVLPAEHRITTDPVSGAKIVFITSHKADDTNLYFHDRSWLFDDRMVIFYSNRSGRAELYGYLPAGGELVCLEDPHSDTVAGSAVASLSGEAIYLLRAGAIVKWELELNEEKATRVWVNERKICDLPTGAQPVSGLNESADGRWVSFGYLLNERYHIAVVDVGNGQITLLAQPLLPIQHIQFSWQQPELLAFATSYGNDTAPLEPVDPPHARINFVDTNLKKPRIAFNQVPGELVTHECWWVNNQITFIGGHRPGEGHVKVMDPNSGDIRIIGAGAWWEGASPSELARVNWWHAAGSRDGRWVAADNWHGIIALFDARTTRMRILTEGHRIYGSGAHPHVGWDLNSRKVVFTSNQTGNPDVCIGFIPEEW